MADLLNKLGDSSSGLSVKSSQNVKEKEEDRNAALQQIHDDLQLSADVTIDVDWPAFATFVDKNGYNDRVGEVIQWFLDGFKYIIENQYKTVEIARNAVNSAWTTGVLKFELATNKKGESKYNETVPRDGDIVVLVYSLSNAGSCGEDLKGRLTDPALNLPLKSALNLAENEEKKEENLKKLQEAVGLSTDVTIDVDWTVLDPLVTKLGYESRPGDVVYDWILGGLAYNVESITKEELTKEAIAEIWTTGVIRMEEDKKVDYHGCEFANGDLVIHYKADRLCSNCGSIGNDIEKKL
jgi:hypothetical protein